RSDLSLRDVLVGEPDRAEHRACRRPLHALGDVGAPRPVHGGRSLPGKLRSMKVGYQGEPGAYSELAVGALVDADEPIPHRTVRAVFDALGTGSIDRAVVPLENSLPGSINETYDLLAKGE